MGKHLKPYSSPVHMPSPAESTVLLFDDEPYEYRQRKTPLWKRRGFLLYILGGCAVVVVGVIVALEFMRRHHTRGDATGQHEGTSNSSNGGSSSSSSGTSGSGSTGQTQKYSEQELYFPSNSTSGWLGGASSANKTYDELVVFGSSYSDNGHPRALRYDASFSPNGYWNHRWSNGPVWTEYLANLLGSSTVQRNYAYGGAVIQRFLMPTGPPDVQEQIETYLAELSANVTIATTAERQAILQRKSLVPTFTTTNDIDQVYRNYLDPTNVNHLNLEVALETIAESATKFIASLLTLVPSGSATSISTSNVARALTGVATASSTSSAQEAAATQATDASIESRVAPDFLILPIIPFELTPKAMLMAAQANTTTDAAKQITIRYNEVLLQGARSLANALGERGSVYTYDTTAWFRAMVATPSLYNLSTVNQGCVHDAQCTNPSSFIWWDNLHIITSHQQRLAQSCLQVLTGTIPSA